jgi:hypothetical protein
MDSAQLVPEFERRVRETKELLRIFGVGKNAISDDKKTCVTRISANTSWTRSWRRCRLEPFVFQADSTTRSTALYRVRRGEHYSFYEHARSTSEVRH